MTCGRANWELLLACARELTAAGNSPFTRSELIACVRRGHRDRQRSSLDPTIQGMTANAPGGPPSAAGHPFVRVARGLYALQDEAGPPTREVTARPSPSRQVVGRQDIDQRVAELIEGFTDYVEVYDHSVPFRRVGQYERHAATIARRRELGSARAALADDPFLLSLHGVLLAWGVGRRASRLAPLPRLTTALRDHEGQIAALDGISIEGRVDVEGTVTRVWDLIEHLPIVDNRAKIVACTKALHHLLPDLVVPMDRAWTGAFFGWTAADPQSRQRQTFTGTYRHYHEVAGRVLPSQFIGSGWRTSATKVLDNAVIGYCKTHGIAPVGPGDT